MKNHNVDYITLKLFVSHSMEKTEVHHALKFRQSHWRRLYVYLNSAKVKEPRNKSEEIFSKQKNNLYYGKKTLERNATVQLVTNRENDLRQTDTPFNTFNEGFASVSSPKRSILWNNLKIVGKTVIDLAK